MKRVCRPARTDSRTTDTVRGYAGHEHGDAGVMSSLPTLSGRKVVKIFESLGWEVARQRGSHIILVKNNHVDIVLGAVTWLQEQDIAPETLLAGLLPL